MIGELFNVELRVSVVSYGLWGVGCGFAYCGYLLITRKFLKGLKLSIFNNALQIIGFGAAGYHFKFVSGFFAGLTLDLTEDTLMGLGFDFSIISLAFGSSSELIFMTINIFAILVLGFIYKMKEKLELKIKSQINANLI